MGSRGGGFLSLVVANGAIYNRVVIPGKTRLLTPHRGTGQGGGIWLSPLRWGRGKRCRAGGRQPARALPSPPAGSPCSRVRLTPSCLLQGHSPCPCPCLALLSSPPGSVCWPRMPELLPVPAAKAGRWGSGHGEGRQGTGWPRWWLCPERLSRFPGGAGCSGPWRCPAETCKPCRASPAALRLPPAPTPGACVLEKRFWH